MTAGIGTEMKTKIDPISYYRTFQLKSHWPRPAATEVGKYSLHSVVQGQPGVSVTRTQVFAPPRQDPPAETLPPS